MNFQEYLISKGFKDFRNVCTKNGFELVSHSVAGISYNSFSTMVSGGLTIEYVKDNIQITWGLEDVGKPPTLLYPLIKNNNTNPLISKQDIHSRLLKKYSNDEIFEAMFGDKILEV